MNMKAFLFSFFIVIIIAVGCQKTEDHVIDYTNIEFEIIENAVR